MTAREDVAFLVGSASRVAVLEQLQRTPQRPMELAETCPCTRETVQRALAGFADRGWVEKCPPQYHLTLGGELVLNQYHALVEASEDASRIAPFAANVGKSFTDLSPKVLQRATVTAGTPENPHSPIDRFVSVLDRDPVDRFRGITPIVSRTFNEAAAGVIGPKTEMELVVDESVLEASTSVDPEAADRASELDQFSLYLSPTPVETGLALFDDYAWLGAYDHGTLVASLDGNDDELVEWVRDEYERVRETAREVEPAPTAVTSPGDE
ncbi:hypothetical protein AUR64_04480 [Haloprofundus marisrubri]|uniref:Uncharacterized protein n=1 Tax=Haloprofundus marisrubri TaxID=1514971 RepID=A0A0W1RDR5_9EURY|nr:MarR family transcriptional regulator [Haloprofundus marisrubri]KTG11194.1 hypothetical protein AUR64_04480 [Haloprofundus marisrubri]